MMKSPDPRRLSSRNALKALRQLDLVHPEITDFFTGPDVLTTKLSRVAQPTIPNDLHKREEIIYLADTRRKFITTDTEVARLYRAAYGRAVPSFLAAGTRPQLAFDHRRVNVGILVAGGTAPGTNSVLHWIVKRHQHSYGITTGHMYGVIGGFRGLERKGEVNVVPLRAEETERIIAETGCDIGMSRYRADIATMVNTLQELQLDILYVVGGDGTLEAAHRIAGEIGRRHARIVVAGIPKTIDNDIVWCWETFGFDTAVDAAANDIRAFHANIRTHGRIGLVILYGGHAGFLAANAALASGVADAVVIPEEPVVLESLLAHAERLVARHDRPLDDHALFVIAEGVAWADSFRQPLVDELRRQGALPATGKVPNTEDLPTDAVRFAFTQILERAFKKRFRNGRHMPIVCEPRSLISAVPPSAQDIRYCQRLAYNAVDSALAGYTDFMSSFWMTEYVLVPLHLVAGRKKFLPRHGAFWSMVRASTGQPNWT